MDQIDRGLDAGAADEDHRPGDAPERSAEFRGFMARAISSVSAQAAAICPHAIPPAGHACRSSPAAAVASSASRSWVACSAAGGEADDDKRVAFARSLIACPSAADLAEGAVLPTPATSVIPGGLWLPGGMPARSRGSRVAFPPVGVNESCRDEDPETRRRMPTRIRRAGVSCPGPGSVPRAAAASFSLINPQAVTVPGAGRCRIRGRVGSSASWRQDGRVRGSRRRCGRRADSRTPDR